MKAFCLIYFTESQNKLLHQLNFFIENNKSNIDIGDPKYLEKFLKRISSGVKFDRTAEELSRLEKISADLTGTQRIGQQTFRQSVLRAYGEACCLTECKEVAVLQAAHIVPYRGENSNRVENGLCLRSDIHTLFDRGLLAINPVTLTVQLNKSVVDGEYKRLDKRPIFLPKGFNVDALRSCLKWHYENVFR